jgi:hypothetical protein
VKIKTEWDYSSLVDEMLSEAYVLARRLGKI